MSLTAASIDDNSSFVPKDGSAAIVNPSTGLLSKLTDTVLDLAGLAGAKALGFNYPTGQTDPNAVQSQIEAAKLQAALTNSQGTNAITKYAPYIILGVGGLAAIALLAAVLRKK